MVKQKNTYTTQDKTEKDDTKKKSNTNYYNIVCIAN